jgi:uncharacterized repeat protein (TIGR03899 family)
MSPNINLINIDGKPLEKLLDVLQNIFGKFYEPKEIRKRADAKAYEIETLRKAEIIGKYEAIELENEYLRRIDKRLLQKEIRIQQNFDNIIYHAATQLKNKTTVSNEPIDEDWINNFFSFAENISNKEMQVLWGRILAGEIEEPGSFSLRALDILRKMKKEDASCFNKFAELSINYQGESFIINFINLKVLEKKYSIGYSDRLLMEELGLVSSQDLVVHFAQIDSEIKIDKFIFSDKTLYTKRLKNNNTQVPYLHVITFTKVGQELLKLVKHSIDLYYLRLFCSWIRKDVSEIKYSNTIAELDYDSEELLTLSPSNEEVEIGEIRTK